MDYESHVFLVNAHAKRDSRYNDLDLIAHPFILDVFTLVVRKLCMIEIALYVVISLQDFT